MPLERSRVGLAAFGAFGVRMFAMIDNATEPLMPLLKALRKNELKVSLLGESARIWAAKDEARAIAYGAPTRSAALAAARGLARINERRGER